MRCLAARDNALNILNSHFTEKLLSLGLKGLRSKEWQGLVQPQKCSV